MSRRLFTVILLLMGGLLFSQGGAVSLTTTPSGTGSTPRTPKPTMAPYGSGVFKPTIGAGVGMFSFYGDLYPKKLFQNPSTSRLAYDITLSQKLNDFLQVNFYMVFGKLGVNEGLLSRHANFESQINLGGFNLQYNFQNILPQRPRMVNPILTLGFEGFEFLSKTDLYDKNGNKYYYWGDGSIKNISETNSTATSAINIIRDYKYETDIRELNLDKFGKYSENSFAIPLGVGVVMHLGERVDLKLHTTMHFTFTDYIDGITEKSVGNRKGNAMNDKFMVTGFSLHWDLMGPLVPVDTLGPDWFNNVDFLALETADSDGDGVRDTTDACPDTPPGAAVNLKGCPLDTDGDGVFDYADKEKDSKPRAIVDMDGITLSDSLIKQRYLRLNDTTNQFVEVITKFHGEYGRGVNPNTVASIPKIVNGTFIPDEYLVLLGTYHSGLSPAIMAKFLSIRDIETTPLPDSVIAYTVGHYKNFAEAQSRKKASIKDGVNDAKVVYKQDGVFVEATTDVMAKGGPNKNNINGSTPGKYVPDGTNTEDSLLIANTKGVVFRVQLGAYKKRLSKSIFKGINDLIEARTEDGLYKYMSGSYSSFNDAAKARTELVLKGYDRSFITAYKDGKRIALTSVGATPASKKSPKENVNAPDKAVSAVNQKLVVYKIQIGVFKNEPPPEEQAKFKALKDGVQQETTSTGLIRYSVGNTHDYNEAVKLKEKMKKHGLGDAFIIAFFNDQFITIQEAIELSK